MENASKALIISGAVLIAIILISIGVLIISKTGGMTDQVEDASDTVAIKTFNSTYEKYKGIKKGSDISQLLIDINTYNNRTTVAADKITLDASGDIKTVNDIVKANKDYRVDITAYNTNGKVKTIKITKSGW